MPAALRIDHGLGSHVAQVAVGDRERRVTERVDIHLVVPFELRHPPISLLLEANSPGHDPAASHVRGSPRPMGFLYACLAKAALDCSVCLNGAAPLASVRMLAAPAARRPN